MIICHQATNRAKLPHVVLQIGLWLVWSEAAEFVPFALLDVNSNIIFMEVLISARYVELFKLPCCCKMASG